MCGEIGEARGRRMVFEVARRAAQRMAPLGQPPHDHARIRRHDRADGEIEAFFDKIGHPIACPQIDCRFGKILQEARHDRRDEAGDIRVAKDPQPAAWRHLQCARDPIGLVELGQDLRAALVIFASDLGQAHFARGAIEKTHAKALLQVLHVLADHARRNIEPRRGAGEAADFRDLGEDPHVIEAIHFVSRL